MKQILSSTMRAAVMRRSLVTVMVTGCLTILAIGVFSAGMPDPRYGTDRQVTKGIGGLEFSKAIGVLADVTISGHLRNVNGRGLSGEPVVLEGDLSRSTITDSTGLYSFTVPSGGNYTVRPNDSRVSLWFPDNQKDFFPLTQSVSNADFQAQFPSFTVSGNVKNSGGNNLTGIKIRLTGTNITTKDYTTNSNGAYTSDQLNILGDYTFTPQSGTVGDLTYSNFNPASTVFTGIQTCSGANCSGFDYLGVNYVATVAPSATTGVANPIAATTATLNGTVNPNGVATNGWFEWGTSSDLATSTSTNPQAIGSSATTQSISQALSSLVGGTTYYFRTVASSAGGTVKGSIVPFTTGQPARVLTIASTNPGSGVNITVSPNDNSGQDNGTTQFTRTYNNNQVVSLTAPATASGNNFQKWQRDGADFANNQLANVSVTMDANHTMTAIYGTSQIQVTVQTSPAGRSFTVDGTSYSSAQTFNWVPSSTHTISTTTPQSGATGTQYIWNNWTDNGEISHSVSPSSNTTFTANFSTYYLLTMNAVADVREGTVSPASGYFSSGQSVNITANANTGYNFTGWTGSGAGSFTGASGAASVTMNGPITETANFLASFNPLEDRNYFVNQHYRDFLDRDADPAGLAYWSDQLAACGSDATCIRKRRIGVSAAFFVELEFQRTGSFVYRLFKGGLARRPTYQEFNTDRAQVREGATLEADKQALTLAHVQRTEFVQKYAGQTTATTFVDALIASILQASQLNIANQRQVLIDKYNTGANLNQSRALVLRDAIESQAFVDKEYNAAFVLMQYFGYLRRDPDQAGYNFWLGIVNNPSVSNYRSMVCAFLTSAEYQVRFSFLVPRNDSECADIN